MAGALALAPGWARRAGASSLAARQWTATGHQFPELASFDDAIQAFMTAREIPAGALAVTHNGKLALARGYTYTDDPEDLLVQPTSLFRIASVTKTLTATATLRLAQDGRLSLDDRLTDWVTLTPPAGQAPDPRLADVTIRRLLQHLGGWDRNVAFDPMFHDVVIAAALGVPLPISQADIMTYMTGQPLQHAPGSTFAYSNYGYCLLGRIIAAATGRPYEETIHELVFTPLSITRPRQGRTLFADRQATEVKYHSQRSAPTVFDSSGTAVPAPYGAWVLENMDSHGGWLSSAIDLVRFAASFDDPAACPILDEASIATMFGLPENIPQAAYLPGDAYYACGWAVRDWGGANRNTWHDGSLDGTYTLLVRRGRDHTNWCVLFDQRDDPSGLAYPDIDPALHAAADAVTTWPDHDLFPEYQAAGLRVRRRLLRS